MKKIILTAALLLSLMSGYSQTPSFKWAKSMGGTSSEQANGIKVDASGNVYSTGIFQGTADFDPGTGTTNFTSNGTADIFISKLDASGNFVWARAIGGATADAGSSITMDAAGFIYVTGSFEGTVDFNPGAGVNNLVSGGGKDIFILKLNASGSFIWAKKIGASSDDAGNSISIGSDANVYTTGSYGGTVDFNPGAGTNNLVAAARAIFVSKLDSSGGFVWANSLGSGTGDFGAEIFLDKSNNVYTTGGYFADGDFDPGAGTSMLTNMGIYDIFISKLDASGNFVWAKSFNGTAPEVGRSIKADSLGNVYVSGFFQGTVDFNPDAGSFDLTSNGSSDVFIAKLDVSGALVWVKQVGGNSDDIGYSLTIDKTGNIYSFGTFGGSMDFDPGAGTFSRTPVGGQDIFMLKLDNSGSFAWANTFGSNALDYGFALTLDAKNNIYSTGEFLNTADFDPGAGTFNMTSKGSHDIFIQKMSQTVCVPSSANMTVTSCAKYVSPSGKYTWTVSNTYKDTIKNLDGCDSVLTINLTIPVIDVTVSKSGNTLTSNATGATYQWIDCNDGNKPISGKTTQSFKPTVDGNYAVIVTVGSCSDTSVCTVVTPSGINAVHSQNIFEIYPNPSNGIFNIVFSGQQEGTVIEVYNTIGALVYRIPNAGIMNIIDISGYANGLYIVKVMDDNNVIAIQKVVK